MIILTKEQICETIRINAENLFQAESLRGWCGLCSAAASLAFTKNGHKNTLCLGMFYNDDKKAISGHAWIEADNKIYDITAEQFNLYGFKYKRVHIGRINRIRYRNRTNIENSFLVNIRNIFDREGWGKDYLSLNRLQSCLSGIMELDSYLRVA